MIKVSVVIPVYKVEEFIKRCAYSLFNQTLDGIEYIFVDDCSPDRSMELLCEVIEEFPNLKNNIKIIRHLENRGLPSARNSGLQIAQGEYVIHCDSDDWVEFNMYELMYEKAVEENADIVGCDFWVEYEGYNEYRRQNFDITWEDGCRNLLIAKQMLPNVWCRMVKRSLYTNNQVNFVPNINIAEDLITSIKLHVLGRKLTSVHEPLYHYVQYNSSSLMRNIDKKGVHDMFMACQEIESFLKQNGLYDKLKLPFLERVFCSKTTLWLHEEKINYKEWLSIYPESNQYILYYTYRKDLKFTYWLALMRVPFVAEWLASLKKYLKRICS